MNCQPSGLVIDQKVGLTREREANLRATHTTRGCSPSFGSGASGAIITNQSVPLPPVSTSFTPSLVTVTPGVKNVVPLSPPAVPDRWTTRSAYGVGDDHSARRRSSPVRSASNAVAPPMSRSSPVPPVNRSAPTPPISTLAPAPPDSLSLPNPPTRTSLPRPPVSTSLPPPPNSRSGPAPPVSTSLPPSPYRSAGS